ncbi:insulin-like growth factor-binding protein 3 [Astyanax mexicanus]|uniref:Insulin-like growth factor-binding protein 3 n=1 Tax=Astyanax mexicanus TaxID=7994 RepID=A0A8T2LUP6_ASTMX|nr:insulin-like growth factor-binding protein 3 [Astyanax mexicanus]
MFPAHSALLLAAAVAALAWLARASSLSSSLSSLSPSSSSSSSSWSRGSGGPVIRCEPCDAGARTLCKPVPLDCAERVREPGCGCCLTCALQAGARCGVYTGRCGAGLACRHEPGEPRPLLALLEGRGVCTNRTRTTAKGAPGGVRDTGANQEVHSARIPEEDPSSNTMSALLPAEHEQSTHHFDPNEQQPPPYPPPHHPKVELIQREQSKKEQIFKREDPPAVVPSDKHHTNFSFYPRQEPEYGPCRREMEDMLTGLKIADMLNPRGFRIPNCDKKGFYKKRQCRPSKGRKRGLCWCVDKYGQSLPGFEGRERGNAQCYAMDNQ